MADDNINRIANNVEDAVTFPILTRETSGVGGGYSNGGAAPGGSLTSVARQTLREVLGWRYRDQDSKGFLAALKKSFLLKDVEGRVEWEWKPQSYTLQADLGEITGAQASIHKQASVVLEQVLPLLDGLEPLRADVDHGDAEAMRAIIRTELRELTNELAMSGGPRVQRVDLFFHELLGPDDGRHRGRERNRDAEQVGGQLQRVRERFGLERVRVNTIVEEQNFTNFLILVDYINGLHASWLNNRRYFDRSGRAEPFLGTQLVLLSQSLDVILEQVRETYAAMDSVFFGAAERQTTRLDIDEAPITVAELLSWVESFAAYEGRQLLTESGKDGVVLFRQTLDRLAELVNEAADLSSQTSSNPVRAFHTRRVGVLLAGLASHVAAGRDLAGGISRTPPQPASQPGLEENTRLDLPRAGSSSQQPAIVTRIEVTRLTKSDDDDVPGMVVVSAEESLAVTVFGANLESVTLGVLRENLQPDNSISVESSEPTATRREFKLTIPKSATEKAALGQRIVVARDASFRGRVLSPTASFWVVGKEKPETVQIHSMEKRGIKLDPVTNDRVDATIEVPGTSVQLTAGKRTEITLLGSGLSRARLGDDLDLSAFEHLRVLASDTKSLTFEARVSEDAKDGTVELPVIGSDGKAQLVTIQIREVKPPPESNWEVLTDDAPPVAAAPAPHDGGNTAGQTPGTPPPPHVVEWLAEKKLRHESYERRSDKAVVTWKGKRGTLTLSTALPTTEHVYLYRQPGNASVLCSYHAAGNTTVIEFEHAEGVETFEVLIVVETRVWHWTNISK